jgi:hypothetical protein
VGEDQFPRLLGISFLVLEDGALAYYNDSLTQVVGGEQFVKK